MNRKEDIGKKIFKNFNKFVPKKSYKVLLKAITNFLILTIVIIAVSYYFIFDDKLIGPVFLILGFLSIIFVKIIGTKITTMIPDILFGFIDNSLLVFAAVIGANFGGIPGAIIGGAVGNTITDGMGGLLEGHIAELQKKSKINNSRTALSSSIGKMIGCLLGAGASLTIIFFFSNFFIVLF